MKLAAMTRAIVAATAFLAVVYVAPGAQAFTIEDQGSASGGQGFRDLDRPASTPDRLSPVSPFNTDNGQTTMKQGNATFQFGQQRTFDERYNSNNLFDPYAREGR